MSNRSALLVATFAVVGLRPAPASAQTTGTVEGVVTDPSGAFLPSVNVQIAGPSLQGLRTAGTGADGHYRFPSVPPGTYTVTATLPGLGSVRRNATVTLDSTAIVNLSMSFATKAEVTVTGYEPLVDSTSTTTGTTYDASVIGRLPVGRNYADIVFSQPGTQADFGETQGRSLAISIYGSTSAENLFLIDGINTTNVVKGFQGKDVNSEFIQQVEVKTGGYQAEYGRNTGGVVNVITKSGGNAFHGGAFGYYNDTGMRAGPLNGEPRNYATPAYSETGDQQFANAIFSKDVRQEYGFDLGGFAVKDLVWFFGAYDRVQVNQLVQPLDPQNTATFTVDYPTSVVQNKYAGKITLNPLPGTSVVGSVFSDAETHLGVVNTPLSNIPSTYAGRQDIGGPDYGARLNQLFGSFGLFTFQYARHTDRYVVTPDGIDRAAVFDYTVSPNGDTPTTQIPTDSPLYPPGLGYVFGEEADNRSLRESYGGVFTAYLGNHEVRAGGDYQRDNTVGAHYITGGNILSVRPCLQSGASFCDLSRAPWWVNPNGDSKQVFFEHDVLAAGAAPDYTIIPAAPFNIATRRYGAFIQDQWRVAPSLTVNAGMRYDSESYYGFDPLTGPFKAFALTSQWAPRVGVSWDFAGDGTSKLYASVGRFYYAIPTALTAIVFVANTFVSTFNYSPSSYDQLGGPLCGEGATSDCVPRSQLSYGGKEPIDPNLKASYQDEATIGAEKAIDSTLTIGLRGIYRTLGRTVEDRCDLDTSVLPSSCALMNPGGTGPAASGRLPTCDGSGNPTDPTAGQCFAAGAPVGPARRIFRGIELAARKQFGNRLWAQGSFLYSSLVGNFSGAVREASGQTDPDVNQDFDYHQGSVNAYGDLELDRPVQARVDAVYNASFGLSAGLNFYVRSGLPISRLGWYNDVYPDLLYLATRGSNGRTPTDYEMNLTLGYNAAVGPVAITPTLYVFNVLNRQTPNRVNALFNSNGSFVTDPSSRFYGQPGIEPGSAPNCPAAAAAPCTDNPDYRKVNSRGNPRLLRVALKVTF